MPQVATKIAILSEGFSLVAVMGVQNLILIKNWRSNSVVELVISLHDSHCFCKWRPKAVVQSLGWPQTYLTLKPT